MLNVFETQVKPKLRKFEECWIFTGCTFKNGYGRVRVGGKILRAHRIAYEAVFGVIPKNLEVMHKCNTKLCCNPNHLKVGTHAENMAYWAATGGTTAHAVGQAGLRGVYKENKSGNIYWTARDSEGNYLKRSKDFFEACCARKSWEIKSGHYLR
jgi:hypothetical protein